MSAEMLRDFPIIGNERATLADGYRSQGRTICVKKGHGLKELDLIVDNSNSSLQAHILHIDSSREDADILQLDKVISEYAYHGSVSLLSRGSTQLSEQAECTFLNMNGVTTIKPPLSSEEFNSADLKDKPTAYMHTEVLGKVFASDRFEVYKGHGLLPGDVVSLDNRGEASSTVDDIHIKEAYDEIVLNSAYGGSEGEANIFGIVRIGPDAAESGYEDLSPDLRAKRDAYLSKLQAS